MALINTTTTGVLGTTVFGDGQGALTVQKDGVTQGVYGNIPAFRAVRASSNQSISSGTWTKVQFNQKDFDTTGLFDITTNYRITPNVAGYYQLSSSILAQSSSGAGGLTRYVMAIVKNGTGYKYGNDIYPYNCGQGRGVASVSMYANGTTDYFEVWAILFGSGTLTLFNQGGQDTFFTGALVRGS